MNCVEELYFIDRYSVGFVKFIFEAYDGIAVVETIDRGSSLIKLHVAPGAEKEVHDLICELEKEITIVPAFKNMDGRQFTSDKTPYE